MNQTFEWMFNYVKLQMVPCLLFGLTCGCWYGVWVDHLIGRKRRLQLCWGERLLHTHLSIISALSKHYLSTISVPSQYHLSTISVPSQHHLSTISAPSQYHPSTISVPSQYHPSTISQYCLCTISVLSQYYLSTIPPPSQYHLSGIPKLSHHHINIKSYHSIWYWDDAEITHKFFKVVLHQLTIWYCLYPRFL